MSYLNTNSLFCIFSPSTKGVATFKPSFKPVKVMATINKFILLNHLQTCFKLVLIGMLHFAVCLKLGLKMVWIIVYRRFKPSIYCKHRNRTLTKVVWSRFESLFIDASNHQYIFGIGTKPEPKWFEGRFEDGLNHGL